MTYNSGAYGEGAYGVGGEPVAAPVPASLHPTTGVLYDALGPGITDLDYDRALALWLDGPASLLGEVDDVVRDTDTHIGWAAQLTADSTLRVRWTAQLLGVRIPDGTSDAAARTLIRERPAFQRGTPGAIIAAARALLTGTQYVGLAERTGSAYRLTVTTYTNETPDPAAVNAALQKAKPAGLILTHIVTTSESYDALASGAAETHTTLEATASQTYTTLEA